MTSLPIFDDYDYVWEIVEVGNGELHFAVTLLDHDLHPPLVTELENAGHRSPPSGFTRRSHQWTTREY